MSFIAVYEHLRTSRESLLDGQVYVDAAKPAGFYVGITNSGRATILIESHPSRNTGGVVFRLKGLTAHTQMVMKMRMVGGEERDFIGGVITLLSQDEEDVLYFLSVCESLANVLGDYPSEDEVMDAFSRIFAIFEKLNDSAGNSVTGILGELLFIAAAQDIRQAVRGWRVRADDRFDFTFPDCQVEIKTSLTRKRKHNVALSQIGNSESRPIYFASILVERLPVGHSGRDLLDRVLEGCRGFPDEQMRIWEVMAQTLGRDVNSYLSFKFDLTSAMAGIRLYRKDSIPAILEIPPVGVSNVRFLSDFSLSNDFWGVQDFWDSLHGQARAHLAD